VDEIQRLTEIKHWHHVASFDNPADTLSRGLNPCDLINAERWWNGPEFLKWDWPLSSCLDQTKQKKIRVIAFISYPCIVDDLLNKYSNLNKICRIIMIIQSAPGARMSNFVSPVEIYRFKLYLKRATASILSRISNTSQELKKL